MHLASHGSPSLFPSVSLSLSHRLPIRTRSSVPTEPPVMEDVVVIFSPLPSPPRTPSVHGFVRPARPARFLGLRSGLWERGPSRPSACMGSSIWMVGVPGRSGTSGPSSSTSSLLETPSSYSAYPFRGFVFSSSTLPTCDNLLPANTTWGHTHYPNVHSKSIELALSPCR